MKFIYSIYYNFLIFIIITVIIFFPHNAIAVNRVNPLIIEQNREQQKNIDNETRKRLNERPTEGKPKIEVIDILLLPEGQCQIVKQIFPYGADKISQSEIDKIFTPVLNLCLDNTKIKNIANQLQNWYLKSGFITTRVSVKQPQNSFTEKGNLEVWVIEGAIGDFILGKNTTFDISRIKSAFPVRTGNILNIHDLDQGLEQLNSLFSQKFRMQIKPSKRPGYSDIILLEFNSNDTGLNFRNNDNTNNQRITFNYSNAGVKSTGEDLYNFNYTKENLLGYNDSFSLSWQRAKPANSNKNETLRFNAKLPLGYWNLKFNYNMGKTIRTIEGNTISFLSKSNIETTQLSANKVLSRSQKYKFEANSTIEFSKRESLINNTIIQTSSREIFSLDLGLLYTHYFKNSTVIISPTISAGLPFFGALRDDSTVIESQPHAEYNLLKLYTYYRHQFLTSSRYQFSIQNTLNFQYSDTPLFGEKQFVLGGEYSIRGFKENVISSDKGISLRNDLILPVGLWMLPWNTNPALAPINFKLFFDVGNGYPFINGKHESISGWGYGLDYNYRWFTASITRAIALKTTEQYSNDEGWINYLNFSARLSF